MRAKIKRRGKNTTAHENFLGDAINKVFDSGEFLNDAENLQQHIKNILDDVINNFSTPGIF